MAGAELARRVARVERALVGGWSATPEMWKRYRSLLKCADEATIDRVLRASGVDPGKLGRALAALSVEELDAYVHRGPAALKPEQRRSIDAAGPGKPCELADLVRILETGGRVAHP
jgi:hypothetical protein